MADTSSGWAEQSFTGGHGAVLAQNWWALALRGVIAILFGLLALLAPGAVLLSLALLFGVYVAVDGVLAIIASVRAARRHERWGLLLLEGLLNLAMGAVALLVPITAVLAFVLITAAWSLVTGGLMLAASFRLTRDQGRWWMALSGVVSLLFGAALVAAPLLGAVVLTWWFAGYAIAFGVFLLVLAFKLRAHRPSLSSPTGGGTAALRR
jgi:uncharacterized membrane protein HdeD (DUF308 family)